MSSNAKKPREIRELRDKLNSQEIEDKQEAIRSIISYMTNGKDVSSLFMDVLKNITTPSLKLKKLIYLYIMNYAKYHPDLAILGVNTFRKDAIDKNNPFLRGLAVRTMGCIRIKDITQYLLDPLKKALKDDDPYVRKTGALCVPKMYQISPKLIEDQHLIELLESLLNDGNATVVSNAIVALTICSEIKGEPLLNLNQKMVKQMLTAMNDCNEWGVVYILDTLSGYIPKDPQQAENVMERVSSKLAHTNSAVALSSIRLIIRYMDYLSNAETIRTYNNKISSPLITMISRQNQIAYLVLKTINLVLQKRNLLLPKQLKIFFVNYHDPLYVKLEKLEVLAKIANNQNILMILHELKEYIHEVDVEFVRKTISIMGKCAIKLEKMADKCVQCLWETLKTKIPYVVQEAVIVIRDIFRKYPKKYDGLLKDICENLNNLDDPEAKASIVWIIGEYIQIIDNADDIIYNFTQNFKDEPDVVQQQILITCMKLYLHRPEQGQEILKDLFKYITKECQNPDLRDRGFIYWRLLSTNPQNAKKVVLSTRPLISAQSYTLETQFLDKLIQNIGTLSSVYCKKPQDFVKKIKENINAKEVIEQDEEQLLAKNKHEEKQPQIVQQQVSYTNKEDNLIENTPSDLMNNQKEEPQKEPEHHVQPEQNLIDLTGPTQEKKQIEKSQSNANIDLLGDSTTQTANVTSTQNTQNNLQDLLGESTQSNIQSSQATSNFNFINQPAFKNIVIPYVEIISEGDYSRQGKYHGLVCKSAFQRQGPSVFLQLCLTNKSGMTFEGIALKMNNNAFKLGYPQVHISQIPTLNPGEEKQVKLELSTDNVQTELDAFPYHIDCALKVSEDVYVFRVPFSLSVAITPNFNITLDEYKEFVSNPQNQKKQETLINSLPLEEFIKKLKDNNLVEIVRQQNGSNQMMVYACQLLNGSRFVSEVIFDKSNNNVTMRLTGRSGTYVDYFNHALSIIVKL